MKFIAFLIAAALATGWSGARAADLVTDSQKMLYAAGVAISQNVSSLGLTGPELEILKAGMTDGVLKRPLKVDMQVYGPKIQQFAQSRAAQTGEKEKKASAGFLAKAAAEPGARKTASGAIVTPIKPGSGASPKATDSVTVNYHGTLVDGTVFDSSVQRGQPATFALSNVIKCWTEAIQEIKVGGKSRVVCPSDIAYGDQGSPPTIKPGATLIFEVDLLEIVVR